MLPKVGDKIYLKTSIYMSHGMDDFIGGWAIISQVREDKHGIHVRVEENPGVEYGWKFLEEKQEEYKINYGHQHAHADPDDRPEFNRWD